MSVRAFDILGNGQRLDGGAMFGNAPKAMWERWFPTDEHNRIAIVCRALLIEAEGRRVLLETGIGNFFEPALKERYGVLEDEHVLLSSLAKRGLSDADIDFVILSHLHFDHAGGLLNSFVAGRVPELLFPNARFITSQTAFARAEQPHPRDRASFIPELPNLLRQSGRLLLVEAEQSAHPELGSSFQFRQSFGHTPGMLHTLVQGAEQSLFFCADLVPGTAWLHLPITMGYDRHAETLIDEKTAWFPELMRAQTWLFFTHDPTCAMARLEQDERGRYRAATPQPDLGQGWAL